MAIGVLHAKVSLLDKAKVSGEGWSPSALPHQVGSYDVD